MECKACVSGKYSEEKGQISSNNCQNCVAGKYSDVDGRSSKNNCKKCPKGRYNDEEGSNAESFCENCGIGKYGDTLGVTSSNECKDCPLGKYGNELGNSNYGRCKACDLGRAGESVGLSSLNLCTKCAAGTFSDIAGITSISLCTKCPVGRWSNLTGSDEIDACILCGRGTYQNLTGQTQQSSCIRCPAGRASIQIGATSLTSCLACPSGKYMESGSSSVSCIDCPKGFSQSKEASFDCDVCAIAKYAKSPGSSRCDECRPGTYGILIGQSSCLLCKEGRYQPEEEKQSCLDCEIGRFNNCQASGFCFDCERGTTTYEPGSTVCVVKKVKTKPAVIYDNQTFLLPAHTSLQNITDNLVPVYQSHETPPMSLLNHYPANRDSMCFKWSLPGLDKTQPTVALEIHYSTNRLFVPSLTNITTTTSTTTFLCIPTPYPSQSIYRNIIYIRVTPILLDAKGTASDPSQAYAISPSCDDESYLDESSSLVSRWRCRPCPIGGNCRGPRRWKEVGVIFGYFRLHDVDRDPERPVETSFWRCFKPLACLGSRNPKMEGRYFSNLVNESLVSENEIDLAATEIEPERCNEAHGYAKVCPLAPQGRCRLCRGCAKGYWPSGYANCNRKSFFFFFFFFFFF
jgi:hypothetical protein